MTELNQQAWNSPAISTVIISIYKDTKALDLILKSLATQTVRNFEVIVSQDCEDTNVSEYLNNHSYPFPVIHLQQEDSGFRKNRALNRAITKASTEHLILIDGDCVPHNQFVEAHQEYSCEGIACTGRRVELGPEFSEALRKNRLPLSELTNPFRYIANIKKLRADNANDYSLGLPLSFIQPFVKNRTIRILGCNVSFHKNDIVKINGFNEDYELPGTGEDTDIDWRLTASGIKIKNVKYTAKLYHLYHEKGYSRSDINVSILKRTQELNQVVCEHGISQSTSN